MSAFEALWWNGVQVIGWILFHTREAVEAFAPGDASPLVEMIKANRANLDPRYPGKHPNDPSKHPHDGACDELEAELRAGTVAWTHSQGNIAGTPADASRLKFALHAKHGMLAHPPRLGIGALPFIQAEGSVDRSSIDHSHDLISLRFSSADILRASPAPPRRGTRGPAPEKRSAIVAAMLKELREGTRTAKELESDTEVAMCEHYGGNRETVRQARQAALSEFRARNSDKTPTSEK